MALKSCHQGVYSLEWGQDMYTFGHLSSKVDHGGYHRKDTYIALSFSVRPCAGPGALHTLLCVALSTFISLSVLLTEKQVERSDNMSK